MTVLEGLDPGLVAMAKVVTGCCAETVPFGLAVVGSGCVMRGWVGECLEVVVMSCKAEHLEVAVTAFVR